MIYIYMEVYIYICIHGIQRGIDPMYRAAPHIVRNNHRYNICIYVYMYMCMYIYREGREARNNAMQATLYKEILVT